MLFNDEGIDGVKLMIMKWCLCDDDHEVSQIDDGDDDEEEENCDDMKMLLMILVIIMTMIKKIFINDNLVMMTI